MPSIEDELMAYIVTRIIKRPNFPLKVEDPLITSGLVDSFHLVDLALFIEETFGVHIADTELNPQTFDTVAQLASLIRQRQG